MDITSDCTIQVELDLIVDDFSNVKIDDDANQVHDTPLAGTDQYRVPNERIVTIHHSLPHITSQQLLTQRARLRPTICEVKNGFARLFGKVKSPPGSLPSFNLFVSAHHPTNKLALVIKLEDIFRQRALLKPTVTVVRRDPIIDTGVPVNQPNKRKLSISDLSNIHAARESFLAVCAHHPIVSGGGNGRNEGFLLYVDVHV
ncbi:hypothetical protein QBC38DRAFT_492173 [Podospora fimiseda]|uniref:Uncharacterized protein n=1 Tax=Podospora fimiseda TaxID=252190 RepID=A0AAN6YRD6_9PEZI|nr:hypothetical protein QBC38DRAFT_492173 [Podospora fimiseda]